MDLFYFTYLFCQFVKAKADARIVYVRGFIISFEKILFLLDCSLFDFVNAIILIAEVVQADKG